MQTFRNYKNGISKVSDKKSYPYFRISIPFSKYSAKTPTKDGLFISSKLGGLLGLV